MHVLLVRHGLGRRGLLVLVVVGIWLRRWGRLGIH